MSYEILVLIPARGGSKGIPRKNVADLGGKPLLAYSIETALKASDPCRVVVSTDCPEIAAVARAYGAEVPFLRPPALAGDRSPLQDATVHCIETLRGQGYEADVHCILLPTHPFRQPRLLDRAMQYVRQGCHNVHSVRPVDIHDTAYFTRGDGERLRPCAPVEAPWPGPRRYYRRYGNIAVFAPGRPTVGSRPLVIDDPIEWIDIDTPADLDLAREVVRHKLYDFDAV